MHLHLVSGGHSGVFWGIPRKRYRNGRGEIESKKAQEGGEMNHLHDLKEWKVKDCDWQEKCVEQATNRIFLSEGCLATDSVEEGDLENVLAFREDWIWTG